MPSKKKSSKKKSTPKSGRKRPVEPAKVASLRDLADFIRIRLMLVNEVLSSRSHNTRLGGGDAMRAMASEVEHSVTVLDTIVRHYGHAEPAAEGGGR